MLQKLIYKNLHHDIAINIEALNNRFDRICFFDSNRKANNNKNLFISRIIAIGADEELIVNKTGSALEELQEFYDRKKGWLFGYLSYDLKNEIEELTSINSDNMEFPVLHFFSPKVLIQIENEISSVYYNDDFSSKTEAEKIYNLSITPVTKTFKGKSNKINIQSKITKEEYINSVDQLKQHIRKGDIYEINFCQEYFAENTEINPTEIFEKFNSISQAPFAAYCKFAERYLICSSPERFLKKHGNTLISQPIKGTIRRSENKQEDNQLKTELQSNPKERSENVMIVDLVRNDLSRIAERGTVKVEELFEIYTFKQVHQMISTISCELKNNISFSDIIKATFPMGSMTGAPKVSAMKLIEEFESTKRGLYSGAVGYIDPNGDFDFNVIIRSILYNKEKKHLSFMVGSAITDKSIAEQEYAECLLKAKAMFDVLQSPF